jgi:hypothetical protein
MLTPFDIRDEGGAIEKLRHGLDTFSHILARVRWEKLTIKVLEEIASGSIDPKTLAIEVLKYRKEK